MPSLERILGDLAEEHSALDEMVAGLSDETWTAQTPAEGWNIRDQIAHLAFFDDQATLAMRDPEAFGVSLAEIARDVGAYMDRSVEKGRSLGNQGVLGWWREARAEMLEQGSKAPPDQRIAWYGPAMSPASFFSARIMETWAHGQDVADTLRIRREAAPRIKHVAHLCVLSQRHSYAVNGLPPPEREVHVALKGPGSSEWTWGDATSPDRVMGSAEDFCLVVTQRRHPADTRLVIEGEEAERWMSVAQAYAGPPGKGRVAGAFPTSAA